MESTNEMNELIIETPRGAISSRAAGEPGLPLIVGIHGWSQRNGWHTWKPLMSPLASAGFFVVSIDMPGWGESSPWTMGTINNKTAIEVVAAVVDALDYDESTLMGKSWGGGIAISAALNHPATVTKLILTAPAFRNLDMLGQLSQPVLMAWAEDDPVIPYSYAAEYKNQISTLQFVSFPTGGHSAAQNNVEQFVPVAIEFLISG